MLLRVLHGMLTRAFEALWHKDGKHASMGGGESKRLGVVV